MREKPLRFTPRIGLRAAAACFVFLSLVGCRGESEDSAAVATTGDSAPPYTVVCTVGMVTDIVRAVAGDHADVSGLIGPGVDPHLYQTTRDDVARLMEADVVFYAGLMLEGKMADTLVKVARSKRVHAVTEEIDPAFLLEPEDMAGHFDPHVWMDASAWAECANAVADALGEFDPPRKAEYESNAAAYVARCLEVHEYGRRIMATVPERSRILITSHDAFNYFGRAYGLAVEGVQGLSTESEAGLQRINQLVDYLVANDVRAVFVETSVPRKSIQALVDGCRSRGSSTEIGGELFSDAMGAEGTYEGTYLGMIDHNLTTVARSLGGEAPAGGFQGKLGGEHD